MQPPAETLPLALGAALAAFGFGSGLAAVLRIRANPGDAGILGLLVLGFLGSALHFVTPLTPEVHLAVLGAGVVLALTRTPALRRPGVAWVLPALIFLSTLANRQTAYNYDIALYYLQTMRWITEYPIVAGLVNLHGRLAYNSLIFPLTGVADTHGTGWIANLVLMQFVLLSLVLRLRRFSAGGPGTAAAFWVLFTAILLLALGNGSVTNWYGIMNADVFVAVLSVYFLCVAIGLAADGDRAPDLAILLFLAVFAVLIKASAAPLLPAAAALVWRYRGSLSHIPVWRTAAVACLVLSVWLARGFTLSGCAIYPAPATCIFRLPWSVPAYQARSETVAIRSWARKEGEFDFDKVLRDQAWIPEWIHTSGKDPSIRLFLLLTPLGLLALVPRQRHWGVPKGLILTISGGYAVYLVFWFTSAPNLRFGRGALLSMALLSAGAALQSAIGLPRFAPRGPALATAVIAAAGLQIFWRAPFDYRYIEAAIPANLYTTPGGNRVFVPSDPVVRDRCWNHPLPCTPYIDAYALQRLRWPKDWPAPLHRTFNQQNK